MSGNRLKLRGWSLGALVLGLTIFGSGRSGAQMMQYPTGQNVVPVFEGWEKAGDGFDMVFGYMNRNYEEEVDIPVGAANTFEPGGDVGQPTHFYLRRQMFVFRVHVPKDFGKKELVWTLTAHGKTEKAYATLNPISEVGPSVYQENRGGPADEADNAPPIIKLVGSSTRTAKVGESISLGVEVADDGHPTPRAGRGGGGGQTAPAPAGPPVRRQSPIGQAVVKLDPGVRLGVTWILYRGGPGLTFEPVRAAVKDGKAAANVSFSKPGTYQIRAYADDGVLTTPADVTVTVTGSASR
jgi:hypothetical protein